MIHDARVVPMDGRPHSQRALRSWMGDSRGRWEGDTLVDRHDQLHRPHQLPRLRREPAPGRALHARRRRHDRYRFTVEDPTTWTRPWTVAYPIVRTDGPIYEFACHEGNYGLRDILSGARYEEKVADETGRAKKK